MRGAHEALGASDQGADVTLDNPLPHPSTIYYHPATTVTRNVRTTDHNPNMATSNPKILSIGPLASTNPTSAGPKNTC